MNRVVVVTGCGGMGIAVARRIGSGNTVIVADINEPALQAAERELATEGYEVTTCGVDVADAASVADLAKSATEHGPIWGVVHTAGLSPVQSTPDRILSVDLLGTAHVLDVFAEATSPGGAGVFIASMAGTTTTLDPDLERRLALAPTEELLTIPEVLAVADGGNAYGLAKRANQLRVRVAANVWGKRGCRVNSISPGIISTPMGQAELGGSSGDMMRSMIAGSPLQRIGTPADIAAATEFLLSPEASFITGADLLVDGGVCASILGGEGEH